MTERTELEKLHVLRANNQEANAITRECIETALIKLMEKKPFQEISITDITNRAGVSRSAYYRNYGSKEDILDQHIDNIRKEMSKALLQHDALTDTKGAWEALFTSVLPFADTYKLLLDAGFGEKILQGFTKAINVGTAPSAASLYYSNVYWAGAISNVVSEWIRNGMDVPLEEMAEIGSSLMIRGIATITDYGNNCE